MKKYFALLLLATGTAYGQIDNPPTTGSIGLGPTNDVTFNKVTTPIIGSDINSTFSIDLLNGSLMAGTNVVFAWGNSGIFAGVNSTFLTNVTVTGNATFSNVTSTGTLIIASPTVPDATNSTGVKGQIAFTNNFLYICVASNTWRRIQLGTFE